MAQILAYDPEHPWLGGNIKGGDPNTYAPAVWDYLISTFHPATLCDVGCGEGHLMDYFFHRAVMVKGYDGLPENRISGPVTVRQYIITHDFRERLSYPDHFDMVISCEFVEHVDEEYSINYLDQFKECNILVFTHAVPGQIGHNHVNCRDDAYWISIMKALNFSYLEKESDFARQLSGGNLWNTVLIFKNNVNER